VQLDSLSYNGVIDPGQVAGRATADPATLLEAAIAVGARIASAIIPDVTVGMHMCRGNYRVDEAVRYVPLENLAISPRCGFASGSLGNLITVDDERRKLNLVVSTARKVWG
jgi:methionine synthase II (cobalamin-independent)